MLHGAHCGIFDGLSTMGNERLLGNCDSEAPSCRISQAEDSFQMKFPFVADMLPIKRSHGHYKVQGEGTSVVGFPL
jgi:hypothetical protein